MKRKGDFKARKEFYKKRQEVIDLYKNTENYNIVEIDDYKYMKVKYWEEATDVLIWNKATDTPDMCPIVRRTDSDSIEIGRESKNQWLNNTKLENQKGILGYFLDDWSAMLKNAENSLTHLKSIKNKGWKTIDAILDLEQKIETLKQTNL